MPGTAPFLLVWADRSQEVRQGCTKPAQFKRLPLILNHVNGAIPRGLILAHLYFFVLSKCMCVFSPLLFLLYVADSSQDLTQSSIAGLHARLFPSSTLSLLCERTKTITSAAADWITWDHRKDIHPDKNSFVRVVPRIWNQTNPLFDQWAPRWWLFSSTQLWPVVDLLPVSLTPLPLENWNGLADDIYSLVKHYLKAFALPARR